MLRLQPRAPIHRCHRASRDGAKEIRIGEVGRSGHDGLPSVSWKMIWRASSAASNMKRAGKGLTTRTTACDFHGGRGPFGLQTSVPSVETGAGDSGSFEIQPFVPTGRHGCEVRWRGSG